MIPPFVPEGNKRMLVIVVNVKSPTSALRVLGRTGYWRDGGWFHFTMMQVKNGLRVPCRLSVTNIVTFIARKTKEAKLTVPTRQSQPVLTQSEWKTRIEGSLCVLHSAHVSPVSPASSLVC